ncbi:Protein of unknown function [Gryllus bimaculatus]|nr:Protein of unknown function [Gryllus bimaculatus]
MLNGFDRHLMTARGSGRARAPASLISTLEPQTLKAPLGHRSQAHREVTDDVASKYGREKFLFRLVKRIWGFFQDNTKIVSSLNEH